MKRVLLSSLTSVLLVSGCATAGGGGGTSRAGGVLGGVENAAANFVLPVDQEIALGHEVQAEFEKSVRLHANPELQDYVARVGRTVAKKASLPPGMKLDFHVVDDDKTVNAVALPGGHIYVYSGLMKMMDDEAELAGVLSHEVAHVAERHVAERLAKAYGIQLLASVALGGNPGVAKQIAASVIANGAMLKFSRSDETEADMKGLTYMTRADYDPKGMVRVFQEMGKGRSGGVEFLQSHPLPASRVDYLSDAIKQGRDQEGRTARAEFQDMKHLL
jgi:beta-barrel assembly-enhancing protease